MIHDSKVEAERYIQTEFAGRFFSGVLCNWYPLRDSEDLRVHFMAAPSVTRGPLGSDTDLYLSAGATYFFEFNLF